MLDIRSPEFTLPEFTGACIALVTVVRFPGSPGGSADILILQFEGGDHFHRIFLDELGEVHWVELSAEALEESLNVESTRTNLPLQGPFSGPLAHVGAGIRHGRTCIQSALTLVFQSGAGITLEYPAEDMEATRPRLEFAPPQAGDQGEAYRMR